MAISATPAVSKEHTNGVTNGVAKQHHVLHTIDSRTGQYHAIPIIKNAINASEFKKVKAPRDPDHPAYQNEQGIRVYDPGFGNTVVSESKVTYMCVVRRSFNKKNADMSTVMDSEARSSTAAIRSTTSSERRSSSTSPIC
jgi:citrate synthase